MNNEVMNRENTNNQNLESKKNTQNTNNGIWKVLIAIIVIIYLFSPIDFMPFCPLDDIGAIIAGIYANKKLDE